jgi:pimeloyl-ACP methyl ester carboxylesterase
MNKQLLNMAATIFLGLTAIACALSPASIAPVGAPPTSALFQSTTAPSPTAPTATVPTPTPPTVPTSAQPASLATPITNILTKTLDAGGYDYVMECRGEGSPVILLFGGRASNWQASSVYTALVGLTRTCTFDHVGRSMNPLTSEQIAKDTHTLLSDAEVTGPYVLVGFSLGGYISRLYTNLYPDAVAGMVLIDASHEDQEVRFLDGLPPETSGECQELKDYRAELRGPHLIPEINLDMDASAAQVRAVKHDLGHLPLVVLTAARSDWPDCFPAEARQRLDQAWLDMQDDLASLSANSIHLVVTDSGHCIPCDQPEVVIDAIQRVVKSAQAGAGVSTP